MKEGTAVLLGAIIIMTIIIGGLVFLSNLEEKESVEKCTLLCEKKGMEYFDKDCLVFNAYGNNPMSLNVIYLEVHENTELGKLCLINLGFEETDTVQEESS